MISSCGLDFKSQTFRKFTCRILWTKSKGFFFTLAPSQFASILQKASVKIRDHAECQKSHGKDKEDNFLVADETVCASVSIITSCV